MSSPNQAATSGVSATQPTHASVDHVVQSALARRARRRAWSPSAAAIRQDRSTCSIGWPRPRSVASENAPTSSAKPDAAVRRVGLHVSAGHRTATGSAVICGVNPGRRARGCAPYRRAEQHRTGGRHVNHAVTRPQPSARWSVGGCLPRSARQPRLPSRWPRRSAPTCGSGRCCRPARWTGTAPTTSPTCSARGSARPRTSSWSTPTVGEVGGRLHLSWRLRVRPAPFGIGDGLARHRTAGLRRRRRHHRVARPALLRLPARPARRRALNAGAEAAVVHGQDVHPLGGRPLLMDRPAPTPTSLRMLQLPLWSAASNLDESSVVPSSE